MNFTQPEFWVFLIVVVTITWRCRTVSGRHTWLLLASYYFYAHWDIRFTALLAFSSGVDFAVGLAIDRSHDPRRRRAWLMVSVCSNLGVLAFFKYFNFFVATIGSEAPWNIILPVGISFFTFQTLSYTIDVYRRRIKACDNLRDFALYVAFFPQLVAGPIVRASAFLPQLGRVPGFSRRRFYGGFQQILRGLAKKVLIADRLAETVDVVFAGPDLYASSTVWLAVLAFAGQIYYDFSGYTDIAVGVAKLLGYRFPVNFRHPYLATSLSGFWQRWHITLSSWLRDYLYIPLGGSRRGVWITRRNWMLTMTLGGLWHGAAMTFVVWGVWHGLALVISGWFRRWRGLLGWMGTMAVVLLGWIFFRADSLQAAEMILFRMMELGGEQGTRLTWWPPLTLAALAVMVIEHLAWKTRLRPAMRLRADRWYSPVVTVILVWTLAVTAPVGYHPFVYFQF